ncbi:hypothetical protein [Streptomyces cacaoi]|uniref:hypothetical protein n=1 Tax=Streptomyces cacaoi TaxID=1898 RepID=UPI002639D001|nr:hypothetical protein [Streptomyces cacaoi]
MKRVFGPSNFAIDFSKDSSINVDLDAGKPMIMDSDRGADVLASAPSIGGTLEDIDFLGPRAADVLAPLPSSSSDPTEAECTRALNRNLSERLEDVAPGQRFCIATGEGRTASMQVVSAPRGGAVMKLKVTIWEQGS